MFRRSLLAGAAVAALAIGFGIGSPARADVFGNLTIGLLPTIDEVPQSQSAPCIICGTNTVKNPANWGFNDFSNRGSDTTFDTFSTNINPGGGGTVLGDLMDNAVGYQAGTVLEAFLNAGGIDPKFTFGVVIDINTAHNGETLTAFQLFDISNPLGQKLIFDLDIPAGGIALPDSNNGNGKGDYLISGFCLSCAGVQFGDDLVFRAAWTGASDGAESFYVIAVPSAVDVPEPGSLALMGTMLVGFGGITAWKRRQRRPDSRNGFSGTSTPVGA